MRGRGHGLKEGGVLYEGRGICVRERGHGVERRVQYERKGNSVEKRVWGMEYGRFDVREIWYGVGAGEVLCRGNGVWGKRREGSMQGK